MSNQLEKLKHSIKKEYVNNFELNLMKSSGFIPVDKRQSDFFVILNKENSAGRAEIIQLIKEKYQNLTPQFIPISGRDFDEVFIRVILQKSKFFLIIVNVIRMTAHNTGNH